MTVERLNHLIELLGEFADEIDRQDAESIAKASSMSLALKLENQHQQNMEHISLVLRWLRQKQLTIDQSDTSAP
jgi:hypothetical protein